MSDDKANVRITVEIIFWAAIVVACLLYYSYVLVPKSQELQKKQDEMKAAKAEIAQLQAELEKKKALISIYQNGALPPYVVEMELRKLGYTRKDKEVIIPLDNN